MKKMQPFSRPDKIRFYQWLSRYYQDPNLQKTEDSPEFSIYRVRITSLLNEYRYLIAFVPRDGQPIGHTRRLSELSWFNFQARVLDDYQDIVTHEFTVRQDHDFRILLQKRHEEYTSYYANEFPVIVSLLHKHKSLYEYPEQGTIISALETYQTIVQFD
jgi:hypothetical protein